MLMQLSHVIVYCSDMKRSIGFYRDQLGFPVKFESPEWTELHTGATTLALHIAPAGERRVRIGPGDAHLGIEVLDLDKFFEEKKALGVPFKMPPTMQDFGRRMAVMTDPDGLAISVTEELR
jgi:catechol 2,3-dioxygenase-like lactoylglutathione lyase family enzyme